MSLPAGWIALGAFLALLLGLWLVLAGRGIRQRRGLGGGRTDILDAGDDNRRLRLAAELLKSDAYGSMKARAQAFARQGGGCRATFYNYRRRLGETGRSGRVPGPPNPMA
jgi:hypothetical protein